MKKFIFLFLISSLLFTSCKEEESNGPIQAVEPPETRKVSDYHKQYLKEISYIKTRADSSSTENMIKLDGGEYLMGGKSEEAKQNELPVHKVEIKPIYVDKTEVTNAEFAQFVEATGYVTTAERSFELKGNTYEPGALVFDPYNPEWWWKFVKGANWQHPQGPDSSIEGKENYPVVQVSWYDAMAYAKWAGKRLPTEAEFEYFNSAGRDSLTYHWGNDFDIAAQHANFYQGEFPKKNTAEDIFEKMAPVKSFPANDFGLYETTGNVWEWCLDTYHPDAYSRTSEMKDGYFKHYYNMEQEKVIRGGSFLCAESYCSGYRVAARMSSVPDTGLEHTGFRCVKDI
ncbi:formylglycine-generating enzyme family protein [uncultured Christiangramia sp.]|uniref:formylglycine-generating enzyme family protein n=1 Tax=uncultured Christiangramia sp. TaxID=503836 RepID=UPI0026075715|nr:formylglycine-generating enzyme family protein [uncultured Christiangramia sp.]